MLKGTLVIVGVMVVALGLLLAYASTQPDDFRISRSIAIKAPPETIYPLISDLRHFNEWNPFIQDDPSVKLVYGAKSAGKGGSYIWDGTDTGQGRIEISETIAPTSVTMDLFFNRPMEAHNLAIFELRPQGAFTELSWTMTGRSNLISKVMGVVFNMDRMVGGQFEKGLVTLKAMAER